MLVNVKLLGSTSSLPSGRSAADVQAQPHQTVQQLKETIREELNVQKDDGIKLLFRGKTLQDESQLSSYNIGEGAKLHLMLQKSTAADTTAPQSPQTQVKTEPKVSLDDALFKALRPHFKTESDTRQVAKAFKLNLQGRLAALSLDDIERVCARLNNSNELVF